MDLYDDPDAVKRAVAEINETLKDYCKALMETGVNGIMLDTLFASGSIMSKSMWDEMEGVYVEELAQVIRENNGLVMIHNCGQNVYFDIQIKRMDPVAISFQYPPDDCADFKECKEKYGKDITLIGCVTPANAVIGTDEEWDEMCKKNIDDMAAGGGFILATGCVVVSKINNDISYVETVKKEVVDFLYELLKDNNMTVGNIEERLSIEPWKLFTSGEDISTELIVIGRGLRRKVIYSFFI